MCAVFMFPRRPGSHCRFRQRGQVLRAVVKVVQRHEVKNENKEKKVFLWNPQAHSGGGGSVNFLCSVSSKKDRSGWFQDFVLKIVCKFRAEQNCPETKEKTGVFISHLLPLLHASQESQVDGLEYSRWKETVIGLPKQTA